MHTGQRFDAWHELVEHRALSRRLAHVLAGERELGDGEPRWIERDVHAFQRDETSRKKSRSGEHDDGEGHLSDNEGIRGEP